MNIYYNPEKFGLKIVEETNKPDLSYEFDMVVAWEDVTTGKQYWAQDSGCSCPSPFEQFDSIESLDPMEATEDEYKRAVKACEKPGWGA